METIDDNYSHINGWGIDADPKNEPTYPMKNYTGDDHKRLNWDRPPIQKTKVEILHSNERPGLTAVFGTSCPPKGWSGILRRFAFKHSESSYAHWLPLLLADRVNVWEGVADDLKSGKIPNIFAERGWKAELKHNPAGAVKKALTGALIALVIYKALYRKKS